MAESLRDPRGLRRQLVDWLRERVEGAGQRGVVFGLSGGIDSAVVCALAVEAVGADRCLGLIMPIESDPQDARWGHEVAARFGVPTLELSLVGPFRSLLDELESHELEAEVIGGGVGDPGEATGPAAVPDAERLARSNMKPRLRMISLYFYANLLGYLVLGTGNKAEFTVGYFTKHGDGGADLFPLGDLAKGEVRGLARHMGVPEEVIDRPPSAGLWEGQTDEEELGVSYDMLDRFLTTGSTGDADADALIERRRALSRHKIEPAPIARPE